MIDDWVKEENEKWEINVKKLADDYKKRKEWERRQ
jgi:hypothetical protein